MNRRQMTMLVWKELEEDRWFFYAGAVAFVVLPLFASVMSVWMDYLTMMASLLPLLAVLMGVGTACRDLRGVETFLCSWPIDARRWVAVKYITGLLVVLSIHALALGAQIALTDFLFGGLNGDAVATLIYNSFTLALTDSVAFLLGCVTPLRGSRAGDPVPGGCAVDLFRAHSLRFPELVEHLYTDRKRISRARNISRKVLSNCRVE